ncbi:hypothetical protein PYK79_27985 [Streptomyces sp. ID05-04B]|nr:hypothetical protein [Streptomyces sp. ID05-04B]
MSDRPDSISVIRGVVTSTDTPTVHDLARALADQGDPGTAPPVVTVMSPDPSTTQRGRRADHPGSRDGSGRGRTPPREG